MKYQAQDVCNRFSELVLESRHNEATFSRIDSVENIQPESMVFISDAKTSSDLFESQAEGPAVIVTDADIALRIEREGVCVIVVNNVRLAQSLIKQEYFDYDARDSHWGQVHSSAVIHPNAKLHSSVRVGPNTVIGPDVEVGQDTHIRSNCVIEHGVKIGQNCVVNNLVNIGYLCVIGDRVIIRPGAVIGNEGFGFAQDEQSRYHRTPHTGIVEIGDDVQIGSNCNIDRATYGATKIARGVKIDALCHIAHNVSIDEDTLFVAQSGVAGSCNIGKRVIASGQTGILDHKTVVDDVVLAHRCGVIEDISESGVWAGTPAKPLKEYVRNLNLGKKLFKLEDEVKQFKKIHV